MSSSSSGPTRSRNKSSFLINDRTTHMYISNSAIYRFEVWKERDAPANHEFVVIRMENLANHSYYRIERRPSNEIVNLIDKVRGCGAEDTITPLSERGYASLPRFADCFICIRYRDPAAPRLQTIFDICKLIHKDRDAEKYTLTKYNCYFFARTLTLLIARYFLVRHYCVLNKSPRNKFCDSGGRHIDTFLDGVIPTRDPWIRIKFFDNSSNFPPWHSYKDLRQFISDFNNIHIKTAFVDERAAYDALTKKPEEIWRRLYSQESGLVVGPLYDIAESVGSVFNKLFG